MAWRLGLDVGTNSIGWAALRLSNEAADDLLDSGVRIFSDGRNPKDGQSLAAGRRGPRQQRKRRDRYLKRRDEFVQRLIQHGLMPTDEAGRKALEDIDPWALRVRGLDQELSVYELGRALFHLQQRRGFKSNRKTDRSADDDKGKIQSAAAVALEAMSATGARTLGEFLAAGRVENPGQQDPSPVRVRLKGSGAKAHYDFYPTRAMVADEFDVLWASQRTYHPAVLTEPAREALRDTLTFQRPLKAQPVGKCSLYPDEERSPRALASVQRLRIYQEINHLAVRLPGEVERHLTLAERDALVVKALSTAKLTFDAARKALKLDPAARFNTEGERRAHLDGDKTAALLAKAKLWGKTWRDLPLATQDEVVTRLLEDEDEADLIAWLRAEHGLDEPTARAVADAPLPDGHGNLGRTATSQVLAELVRNVVMFDQAVRTATGQSHSDLDTDGEIFERNLPYYGQILERHVTFGSGEPADPIEKRFGKIANPTVHVALNQLRRVVNALTAKHGPPAEIVVELGRDLPLSAKGKSDLARRQRDNQDANDHRRARLAEQGQQDSYDNRLRLRLWEELNPHNPLERFCPYSGELIGIKRLFTDEIEIEHILPFSKTLDDSPANKTVATRNANRFKTNQSPHAAFGHSPKGYSWEQISDRAVFLPGNKSWRFAPDAMERFENEERDFLDRQLVDTRYFGRIARTYLARTGADVWVTPGRLTADLRWTWGLDSILLGHNQVEAGEVAKNRDDHRHHAIDAIVVGLTDRSTLKAGADAARKAEENFDGRLLADLPAPWEGFREDVRRSIDAIVVSHKPDHGVQGALHNDTAYGIVEVGEDGGASTVVHRVPLASLGKPEDLEKIRDDVIRRHLLAETEGLTGKDFTAALVAAGEAMRPPVRRVRILETVSVIPITDKAGRAYKAYKGDANHCYDIFADQKGRWTGRVVSSFEANQPSFDVKAKTTADGQALIMRIRQNDMLAIGEGEQRRFMRVVKFSKGQIVLADHSEGGSLKKRDADKEDPFKYLNASPSSLGKRQARLVHVHPSGRVFDPGPSK
ncbi:MAG: type II CRISPR RNA-guided endonuclease Cas9 [Rhodospirillaceae bacterium]|nr:type II CRISPR RNA-guided endonuclease Cas9 [Rhodospirillaceae bacterium]